MTKTKTPHKDFGRPSNVFHYSQERNHPSSDQTPAPQTAVRPKDFAQMRKLKEETVYKKKPCCNIAYLSDHRYLLSCLSLRVFTCYVRYLPQNLSIYRIYIYAHAQSGMFYASLFRYVRLQVVFKSDSDSACLRGLTTSSSTGGASSARRLA